ncbi:MAG: VCBS repeat-containing protein, partial [Synergistaceae bacterium]|nr:VCBS repeat-containing protein [Synergistaceae bacterium]
DGKDEAVLIYSQNGNLYMSMTTPDGSGVFDPVQIDTKQSAQARLTALAADLDGDGRDELVWDLFDGSEPENLHIHTWPNGFAGASVTDPGDRFDFSVGGGSNSHVKRSITAVPYSSEFNDNHHALALLCYPNDAAGSAGTLAILPAEAFQNNGTWRTDGATGSYPTITGVSNVNSFALAAADLYDETTILGEPIEFTLTGQVKPRAIIQAPPKHWDVISYNGVSVSADAFSLLTGPTSATHGYEVDFSSSGADKTIAATTNSSSFSVGENASVTVSVGNAFVKDSLTVGLKAAQSKMEESTTSETKTTTVSFSTEAHNDDQLYYTETDYTIWRYPLLRPWSLRLNENVSPDDPTYDPTYGARPRFVQFVAPALSTVDSSALSTPGSNVSWYQPLFDTYNLFTYPRDINQAVGYPSAADKPGGSSWAGLSGKLLFSFGSDIVIGDGDEKVATVSTASGASSSDTTSASSTLSVTESDTLSFNALFVSGKATVGSNQDWASSSAQMGTTDVSNMGAITLFWPGGTNYRSPSNYTMEDQQFHINGGVYTQDDGTLRVSFAVPTLQNTEGSNLWGGASPYMALPDPGLLLPWRYSWLAGERVATTAPDWNQIRGVGFSNYSYNVLPAGAPEKVTFRVFNYSFKNSGGVAFAVYYQPQNSGTDGPDISKATQVASGVVPLIFGRSNDPSAPDNWEDVTFDWTTPSEEGNGFLHIVLNPAGGQLSTANDAGYIEVGIYDADEFFSTTSASAPDARAAGAMNARAKLETEGAVLSIESLVIQDEDGNELQGPLPVDKPFKLATTVRLDGRPQGKGLPLVKVNLYVDGIPIGSKHIPYLGSGYSRTITMNYNPLDHADVKPPLRSLGVRAFSELTGFSRDGEDSLSQLVQRDFTGGSKNGGGGCDAGLGGLSLAIFAALGAALPARKKRG